MQIRIFTLPLFPTDEQQEELNLFLRSHKVIEVRKELGVNSGGSIWCFCVTYMIDNRQGERQQEERQGERAKKVDYKEVLEPLEFERFAKMRRLRKRIADAEAVPAYAVFTDAELAEMAKLKVLSTAEIAKVPGIGKKKTEKYASQFCDIDNMEFDEKGGTSDGADS